MNYRTLLPGLRRRMEYSRELDIRRYVRRYLRIRPVDDYEFFSSLEPVYVGVDIEVLFDNSYLTLNTNIENFCTICQDDIDLKSPMRILKCTHVFHNNCIIKCSKLYNKCPTCRESISY